MQEAVRLRDHAGFLAASFYPPALRSSYLALRAFNVELAALPESVSNSQLGRIRMQWWRQAVDDAFKVRWPQPSLTELLRASLQITQWRSASHTRRIGPSYHANISSACSMRGCARPIGRSV